MKKRVIGIALALTMMGGAPLLAKGPELHSAKRTNAYAKHLDSCPYYPSPVFCHTRSDTTTTGSAPSHRR